MKDKIATHKTAKEKKRKISVQITYLDHLIWLASSNNGLKKKKKVVIMDSAQSPLHNFYFGPSVFFLTKN